MTVNTASIPGACCLLSGIIPETILADGSQTAHLLWGQYKEPLGSSSQAWNWSSHWHGPTVLSTVPEWSLGEINLPAMQLHVKLACGIAYGMTIGWLVSQTWEDAKKNLQKRHTALFTPPNNPIKHPALNCLNKVQGFSFLSAFCRQCQDLLGNRIKTVTFI